MNTAFVDTNILIRLLTGDDLTKQAAAQRLFEQIQASGMTVYAPDTVIADAVFVLASKRLYHVERAQVAAMLIPLVRLPHFHVSNRRIVLRSLTLYAERNIDFGDAMIVAAMEQRQSTILYSFDTDFDSLPGITRIEPPAAARAA